MDNTSITKKYLNFFFFPKILISFKKLKLSWNNMRSDLAVKWLSLISIKSEQVSKICSMVKRLSHPMHTGGSSSFNKKEWVIEEWPMCNRAITVSSFPFIYSFNIGNIYFPGTHPTQTDTILIYIYMSVILGMRMQPCFSWNIMIKCYAASALCTCFYSNPAPIIRSTQFYYCTTSISSNLGTRADDAFVLKRCM